MAYINAQEVKAIRNELKRVFPTFKFAVRKSSGGHSVCVSVLKGERCFADITENGYAQINPYHLHFYPKHEELFEKILKIIKTAPAMISGGRGWYDNSNSQIDYFDTAYYFDINVGDWNKPYQLAV